MTEVSACRNITLKKCFKRASKQSNSPTLRPAILDDDQALFFFLTLMDVMVAFRNREEKEMPISDFFKQFSPFKSSPDQLQRYADVSQTMDALDVLIEQENSRSSLSSDQLQALAQNHQALQAQNQVEHHLLGALPYQVVHHQALLDALPSSSDQLQAHFHQHWQAQNHKPKEKPKEKSLSDVVTEEIERINNLV